MRWTGGRCPPTFTCAASTALCWIWAGCPGRCCRSGAGRKSNSNPNGPSRRRNIGKSWPGKRTTSARPFISCSGIWAARRPTLPRCAPKTSTGRTAPSRIPAARPAACRSFTSGIRSRTSLRTRPPGGCLLPMIARCRESDRAKAFIRRCRLVGVSGVTLHSYRYVWAERARQSSYPERLQFGKQRHYHRRAFAAALLEVQQMLVALRINGQRHHHAAFPPQEHPVHHQGQHRERRAIPLPELGQQLPAAGLPARTDLTGTYAEQLAHAPARGPVADGFQHLVKHPFAALDFSVGLEPHLLFPAIRLPLAHPPLVNELRAFRGADPHRLRARPPIKAAALRAIAVAAEQLHLIFNHLQQSLPDHATHGPLE